LVRGCSWNNHIKQLAWRVDIKTASKNVAEINEPVAMLELSVEKGTRGDGVQIVRCGLSRAGVSETLRILEEIQHKIEELSG
jgi:nicotinic acid mononucleotide adenylyltransferase